MAARVRRLPAGLGWPAILGLVALALFARAVPVLRGGGLTGYIGYDDGVYFGGAIAFVHGALPYRDVLFLHPPGIIALLSPFAAIGALTDEGTGLAMARCVFILLGVLNTVLVAVLASKHSRSAGLLAGILYAAWHATAGFERTTLLVPPQTTLLLLALLCLHPGSAIGEFTISRRREIVAGALLGFAAAIQLWGIVPLVVIGSWLGLRASRSAGRPRLPVAFAAAAGLTFAAVILPFLAASGDVMIRQIVLDQLGRPSNGISLVQRLRTIEGLGQIRPSVPDLVPLVAAVAAALAIAWVMRRSAWVRIFAVLSAVQTAVILMTPVSFPHYAAWPAPAGAVAFGVAGALFLEAMPRPRIARMVVVGYALATAILLVPDVPAAGQRLQLDALASDVSEATCVAADEPILLIELSRIGRSVAAGCAVVVDPSGVGYDTDRGLLAPGNVSRARAKLAGYQRAMLAYFKFSGAALFARPALIGLSTETWAALRCTLPVERQRGSIRVLLPPANGRPSACPR
jgi:hypothetical protein